MGHDQNERKIYDKRRKEMSKCTLLIDKLYYMYAFSVYFDMYVLSYSSSMSLILLSLLLSFPPPSPFPPLFFLLFFLSLSPAPPASFATPNHLPFVPSFLCAAALSFDPVPPPSSSFFSSVSSLYSLPEMRYWPAGCSKGVRGPWNFLRLCVAVCNDGVISSGG